MPSNSFWKTMLFLVQLSANWTSIQLKCSNCSFSFKMTSKGEIFCNIQLFSLFSSDQWRRKIPLCGSSNISPKFPDEKVTDCDHLDLLHSAKTCAILLLHPSEEINFSWTGYWSKNNLRSKLVFEVVQSLSYKPAGQHNQALIGRGLVNSFFG